MEDGEKVEKRMKMYPSHMTTDIDVNDDEESS